MSDKDTVNHMDVETFVATEGWMSPLNKIIWLKAFHKKAKIVTIRDGRKFDCVYFTKTTKPPASEKIAFVKVDPAQGQTNGASSFVPCGTFRMSEVTDAHWLSDARNAVKAVESS